jgi:hypothetical protein
MDEDHKDIAHGKTASSTSSSAEGETGTTGAESNFLIANATHLHRAILSAGASS